MPTIFPSPWCTIGPRPILWHLMKYYAHFGHKDFILCLGYKGNCIKDYFLHYDESVSNDFVWSEGGKKIDFLNRDIDDWKITFVETGANSNIGERLKAVEPYLAGRRNFSGELRRRIERCPAPGHAGYVSATATQLLLCCLVQPTASFDIVNSESERDGHRNSAARPAPIFGSTADFS